YSGGDSLHKVSDWTGKDIRLYSDGNFPATLYAVEIGGTQVLEGTGRPLTFTALPAAPEAISCFTSDNGGGGGPAPAKFWIACGKQIYRFIPGASYVPAGPPMADSVRSLDPMQKGDIVVGLKNG